MNTMADGAIQFAIVLGVFVFGIVTLWLARQSWRGLRWMFAKQPRTT